MTVAGSKRIAMLDKCITFYWSLSLLQDVSQPSPLHNLEPCYAMNLFKTVTALTCLRTFHTCTIANEAGSLHWTAGSAIRNVGLPTSRRCYGVNKVVGGFNGVGKKIRCVETTWSVGRWVGRSVRLSVTQYRRLNFRWIFMKFRLTFSHKTMSSNRECGDVMWVTVT